MCAVAAGYEGTRDGLKLGEQATGKETTDQRDQTTYEIRVMTVYLHTIAMYDTTIEHLLERDEFSKRARQ